jgi:hypothetical protein
MDFEKLWDASMRREDLLGPLEGQKLRLMKLFALRAVFKWTSRHQSQTEKEYHSRKSEDKRAIQNIRRKERKKALAIFNNERVISKETVAKAHTATINN